SCWSWPGNCLRTWTVQTRERNPDRRGFNGTWVRRPQLLRNRNWICYEGDGSGLMLVGATVAQPHALERRLCRLSFRPAEAYAVAELHIVINYSRWRLRRKRN